MRFLPLLLLSLSVGYECVYGASTQSQSKNLVCFYDSSSYLRNGDARLHPENLEMALQFCTHLVYGYAGLKANTHEIFSLNVDLDMFYYREITMLKKMHPKLRVYLSVGGDMDIDETADPDDANKHNKYIEFLESGRSGQQNFIDTAIALLKRNQFDGLDLAFQFPRNKPRAVHNVFGAFWKKIKKVFTGDFVVDPKADEHKAQYTDFVKNISEAFGRVKLDLTMTVLPNVNSTWYFNVSEIHPYFKFVNLAAFDFLTPQRNPEEADYTSPLYPLEDPNRLPHYNVDNQVKYWLNNGFPRQKLNLGIATYGNAWKLTAKSGQTPTPVVPSTEGPVDSKSLAPRLGQWSWPEICTRLTNSPNMKLSGADPPMLKVTDIQQKNGNYAYRATNSNGENGMWVSFDDPDVAGIKTNYVKGYDMGGIALFDLSTDDFRGTCSGQSYPFLRTIKYYL